MPSKNIVKSYVENGYYHVYNRGVEKRLIFLDEQDCKVFLRYIKLYLSPLDELKNLDIDGINRFIRQNLSQEVDLLCFALMPNHFHLLIKQHTKDGLVKFMRRLITSYVMYFNKKYIRVGSLFQNKYKACLIENDDYLLHISRYIHRNAWDIVSDIDFMKYSSYPYYLGFQHASWVKPQEVFSYFNNDRKDYSYKSFVEQIEESSEEILGELTIDQDDSIKVGPL